ncbi:DUF423 domain-containing protein [Opitutaceae bacterium]|nr:DUF423 domain-containing protein [Opitutaceae bacterium]
MNLNKITFFAALVASLGVALGAAGAHALQETLLNHGTTEPWNTAVLYHLVHGVAAWATLSGPAKSSPLLIKSALAWLIGILLFSGSLYVLALGGPRWMGPVTPLGGLAFIAGWLMAARAGWRGNSSNTDD